MVAVDTRHQHMRLQPCSLCMSQRPHASTPVKGQLQRRFVWLGPASFNRYMPREPGISASSCQVMIRMVHQSYQPPLGQPSGGFKHESTFASLGQRPFTGFAVQKLPVRHALEQPEAKRPWKQRCKPRQQHNLQQVNHLPAQALETWRCSAEGRHDQKCGRRTSPGVKLGFTNLKCKW